MRARAAEAGMVKIPIIDESVPRIEILTIKDLIENRRTPKIIELLGRANVSYKKAEITKEEKERKRKGQNKKL